MSENPPGFAAKARVLLRLWCVLVFSMHGNWVWARVGKERESWLAIFLTWCILPGKEVGFSLEPNTKVDVDNEKPNSPSQFLCDGLHVFYHYLTPTRCRKMSTYLDPTAFRGRENFIHEFIYLCQYESLAYIDSYEIYYESKNKITELSHLWIYKL